MSEHSTRLRELSCSSYARKVCDEAADEIERLLEKKEQQHAEIGLLLNRIEELESTWEKYGQGGYVITTDQIRAAWEHANTHVEVESRLVEFALNELGIVRDGDGWRMG